MKFSYKLLSALTVSALLAAPAMAQKHTWTMTSTWPSSLELMEIDKKFVELANKLVGDELHIEFHEGGALVPSTEVFSAVESGTIEAGGDWPGYWAGRDAAFSPLGTHTSLFNAIDVNLLTSLSESFPYALLEGAKMKKPFIATNVGGIPEMVGNSEGAWLFEPKHVNVLSHIFKSIVRNRDQIKIKGDALYQHVQRNFSVGAMAGRHVEIYEKILQEEQHENR